MKQTNWPKLNNLISVAAHAIYIGEDFKETENDANWFLQPFQKGEPPFYTEHIRRGIVLAHHDPNSLLIFSGGQTRLEAGPRSEAQSYWLIAEHYNWYGTEVKGRATTEEFARDSFENLLFSICRFYECTKKFPDKITVVSWAFKKERFELHRRAIKWPEEKFVFDGFNLPVDLEGALKGEKRNAIDPFTEYPYGTEGKLKEKRIERNPFHRRHGYSISCCELKELLNYSEKEIFRDSLPWNTK